MKKFIKHYLKRTIIFTFAFTTAIVIGARITTLTQTASSGDKITPEWVNEVNKKLATWWTIVKKVSLDPTWCADKDSGCYLAKWNNLVETTQSKYTWTSSLDPGWYTTCHLNNLSDAELNKWNTSGQATYSDNFDRCAIWICNWQWYINSVTEWTNCWIWNDYCWKAAFHITCMY